jgi:hypothetical protein
MSSPPSNYIGEALVSVGRSDGRSGGHDLGTAGRKGQGCVFRQTGAGGLGRRRRVPDHGWAP